MVKVLFPVSKIRKTAGGAPLSYRSLLGGLPFALFAKGGGFSLPHLRLLRPISSFPCPIIRTETLAIRSGELWCWARRVCRTYGAAEFLRGL
jgi:hypothetical protein